MRIAICEDDATQSKLILKYISEWGESSKMKITADTFKSAESYLFNSEGEKPFDLLLLDIQMEQMSGMELAKKLREQKDEVPIVFITALKEYVYAGYDVEALGYILKPIDKQKLFECLTRADLKSKDSKKSFAVIENQRICTGDIMYIEVISHYISIYTRDGEYRLKGPLGKILEELNSGSFVRCHRSYVLNIDAVSRILKEEAVLDDGRKVPISRGKYGDVNSAFISHFKGKII